MSPSSSRSRRGLAAPQTHELFSPPRENPPQNHLVAYSDGGARGNPGPAGYGVVIQNQSGRKVAALSQYLGHQTNNFAEYQGLIAALEYALEAGPKAIKVVSDSELLVRQIKGIYKVKNLTLQELHGRAKELIAQLDWFSIQHVLRDSNREADELANAAMDKGMGRAGADRVIDRAIKNGTVAGASPARSAAAGSGEPQEFEGTVTREGLIRLRDGELPEGARVEVRLKNLKK
jgi:ribonuclease HI